MAILQAVPDAPYIREAETIGYPTDDSPLTMANLDLSKADRLLNQVYMHISQAASKTEGTMFDPMVMDLLFNLGEFQGEIFKVKSQIERRELD